MRFRFGRYALMIGLLLLIGASLSITLIAQGGDTILTIGIDEWQQNIFNDETFDAFEEAHPGVKVVLVILNQEDRYYGTPATPEDVPDFLERVGKFAGSADLLPVNMPGTLNNMYTHTGAFLDISPLLNADANANLEDFYPAMLQSFQWDGGTWGLPLGASMQFIVFNKTAFDEAGIPYPDNSWTLADYMSAGRELTIYGSDGKVEVPGFYGFDSALILRAGYGRSLYDANSFSGQLELSDPDLISMVQDWAAYEQEIEPDFERGGFNFEDIPMTIGGIYYLDPNFGFGGSDSGEWGGALLPNGTAGMYLSGYSISGGTAQPQLAYELLQYMSQTPEIAYSFGGDAVARQSLRDVEVNSDFIFRPELEPESQAMLDAAVQGAIPATEVDSFRYVQIAMWAANDPEAEEDLDIAQAMQKAEEDANEILAAIDDAATTTIVTVATPIPTPVLQSGEVALRFGSESYFGPSANRDLWQDAIREFAAQDPEVRHIELGTEYLSLEQRVTEQDCFYIGYNSVPDMDLSLIRSLDPYLAADPNFEPNNMVAGTISQVSRDGMVWAMPMSLTPTVLWYDPNLFEEAGLPVPTSDWTIYDWEDSLRQLYDGENPVFQSQNFGGQYILMFAAAYGGVPLDYNTQPYSILTDAASIQALQTVLDLAKEGLLDYQELANFAGGGGGGFGGGGIAMFDSQLVPNDWRLQNRGEEFGDPSRVVMFPSGRQFTPVSYSLAVGMISAESPAADACYRWLSFLAQRPELLSGMPARKDSFDAALNFITDGEDVVQLYRDFAATLERPDALVMPTAFSGGGDNPAVAISNYVITLWVYRSFDNYVLEDGDIEAELLQAQSYLADFNTCISGIEIRDLSEFGSDEEGQKELQDYYVQFMRCAVDVDPALEEVFRYSLEQAEEE